MKKVHLDKRRNFFYIIWKKSIKTQHPLFQILMRPVTMVVWSPGPSTLKWIQLPPFFPFQKHSSLPVQGNLIWPYSIFLASGFEKDNVNKKGEEGSFVPTNSKCHSFRRPCCNLDSYTYYFDSIQVIHLARMCTHIMFYKQQLL